MIGAVANVAVAVAPNFVIVLLARVLLGIGLAGFWALSFGAGVRASGGRDGAVSSSLAFGVSVATVIGVPLASLASDLYSWRLTFLGAALVTGLAAIVVRLSFPAVPAAAGAGLQMLREVASRRRVRLALICIALLVVGNFAAYPYIRVAIERLLPQWSAALLVIWGVGAVVGSLLAGALAKRLLVLAVGGPALLAVALFAIGTTSSSAVLVLAVMVWGVAFSALPVATLLWVTRSDPERAEAGTSLQVMTFQLAIMLGAAAGGAVLDAEGVSLLYIGAACAVVAGGLGFALLRSPERA